MSLLTLDDITSEKYSWDELRSRFLLSRENAVKLRPQLSMEIREKLSEEPVKFKNISSWSNQTDPHTYYTICQHPIRAWNGGEHKAGYFLHFDQPCVYCNDTKADTKIYQIKTGKVWKFLCYQCLMKIEDDKLTA